jgi:hypothetical protein
VNGYYDSRTAFEGVDVFGPMSAGGDSGSLTGIVDGGEFRATDLLFARPRHCELSGESGVETVFSVPVAKHATFTL